VESECPIGPELGGEPDGGDATEHAVRLGAGGGGQGRGAPGAIDEEGETLLEVVDGRKIVGERREFGGEDHAGECNARGDGGQPCSRACRRVSQR
jgi:hypothetical protein